MEESGYVTLSELGFDKETVDKAIQTTQNSDLHFITDWLLEHGTDKESSDATDNVSKSIICQECKKMFKNNDMAQFHAYKSGHQSFEESTEELKPLTEEEKKRKIEELRLLIAEKRRKDEVIRRQEELQTERARREQAKHSHKAKEAYEAQQIKMTADKLRKEKEDDRLYMEKLRQQIESDKKERMERMHAKAPVEAPREQPAPIPVTKRDYTETKLQIRLSSGNTIVHTFKVDDRLEQVYAFLKQQNQAGGTLMTTFPRKALTDMSKTLKELDLVPSAALMLN